MERSSFERSVMRRYPTARQGLALGGSALALLICGCEASTPVPDPVAVVEPALRPPVPEHCKILSGIAAVHGKAKATKVTIKQPADCTDAKINYFALGNATTPISGFQNNETITVNCQVTEGEHAPSFIVQGRTPETPVVVPITPEVAKDHSVQQAHIPGCVLVVKTQETTR